MFVISRHTRKRIVETGIYFLILLFAYTSTTKLLERDQFYLNLLNSPILLVEKQWIAFASWFIPFMELFIVFLLVFPKTKWSGLYLSVGLLGLYTFYILTLLFVAPYQPCSCGSITALFSWGQQLWFTLGCLGFAGVLFYLKKQLNPEAKNL